MSRTILPGLILTSVTLDASAQIILRWGARQGFVASDPSGTNSLAVFMRHPAILGGLACCGFSLLVWLQVLTRAYASFAYPILAFGFALVAFAGWCELMPSKSALCGRPPSGAGGEFALTGRDGCIHVPCPLLQPLAADLDEVSGSTPESAHRSKWRLVPIQTR